jgi:hypothetical protein
MIEILPFNKTLFNNFTLDNKKITKYCYINDINLIGELLTMDLPITNKKLALRNIFDFLSYIDIRIEEDNTTLLPIHSSILIDYFSRDTYKKYIELFEELKIITKVPYDDGSFYKAPLKKDNNKWLKDKGNGGVCSQYRIHNSYIQKEELAIIILEDDRSKNIFTNTVDDIDERYINTIKILEVNIPKAIEAEIEHFENNDNSMFSLRSRIARIFYTARKRFIKKGVKVDRIYHSFTNLSKVSRKHLNINMYNLDISNCQPLLLVAYMVENNLEYDIQYQLDCEQGNFYEQFYNVDRQDKSNDEWRTFIKENMYKNIFFTFNKSSKYNKRMKELYPNTWNSLNDISKKEKSLASQLQNLESRLFNKIIPEKSKYFFTLFDAIYFDKSQDRFQLEKNIKSYFNSFNIKVTVK